MSQILKNWRVQKKCIHPIIKTKALWQIVNDLRNKQKSTSIKLFGQSGNEALEEDVVHILSEHFCKTEPTTKVDLEFTEPSTIMITGLKS